MLRQWFSMTLFFVGHHCVNRDRRFLYSLVLCLCMISFILESKGKRCQSIDTRNHEATSVCDVVYKCHVRMSVCVS